MSAEVRWPSGRRLILMRHGETYEPRPDSIHPGPDRDPERPLTERGLEQLAEVARWMQRIPLASVFASPYLRSAETARIVAEPHDLPVETFDELRELAIHAPAGSTLQQVALRYVELLRILADKGEYETPLDCGRSLGQVVDAAVARVDELMQRTEGPVLVVAHGGLNRFLLARWLGMPPLRAIGLEQNFACLNVVEFLPGGHTWVRALNATLHDPFKLDAPGI